MTARAVTASRAAWGTVLDVPERSQMVYPNGGPVWCSPTSTSMVMAYWSERLGEPALNRPVPEVAAAVYDVVYRGNGNWPFNTAYAGRDGLVAYVSRMSTLGQVERWIEAGVPVVASDLRTFRAHFDERAICYVRGGEAAALADGIMRIAAQPSMASALASEARRQAEPYTWRVQSARYLGVVEGLVARARL